MDRSRFVIEPEEAKSIAENSGLTVVELLPSLLNSAQSLARPHISSFKVGAVAVGSSGRIFIGSNIQFQGLPLHHTIHAEQFLVANLVRNAEPRLTYLALSASPCGHCRQFLQEIRDASDIKILIRSLENTCLNKKDGCEGSYNYRPLSEILPVRFGPDDLLSKDFPLLLESRNNRLVLDEDCDYGGVRGDLKSAALEAANKSYAPYSNCPSGVALMDCEGRVYTGFYMESAAYSPSLGPVQAAIVAYLAESGGSGGYESIVAAALVEKKGGVVKQEETARLFFQVVAPKCDLHAFYCREG